MVSTRSQSSAEVFLKYAIQTEVSISSRLPVIVAQLLRREVEFQFAFHGLYFLRLVLIDGSPLIESFIVCGKIFPGHEIRIGLIVECVMSSDLAVIVKQWVQICGGQIVC